MSSPRKKTSPTAAAVATAQARLRDRQVEHEQAVAARESLDARLAQGDEAIVGADLTAADNEVLVAGARLKSARAELKKALDMDSLARARSEPVVASAVVRVLRENAAKFGLFGVGIELLVDEVPEQSENLPVIYVQPTTPAVFDLNEGTASGECIVHLLIREDQQALGFGRAPIRAALNDTPDVGSFEFGGLPSTPARNGIITSSDRVSVKGLLLDVPRIIGEPPAFRLAGVGSAIRDEVTATAGLYRQLGVGIGAGSTGTRVSRVAVKADEPVLRRSETDEAGLTHHTVEVGLYVGSREMEGELLQSNTARAVENLAGRFITGVGRVESAGIVDIKPVTNGREVTARLVLVSRAA